MCVITPVFWEKSFISYHTTKILTHILVSSGFHNKRPETGLTTEIVFSHGSGSWVGFSWGLSPWHACGHLLTVSSYSLPSFLLHPLCLFVCPNFFFLEGYQSGYIRKWRKWSRSVVSNSLWTHGHQAPPSMGFSRQEYWSGLPFPSPGSLPNPGIEPRSPAL